MAGPIAWSWRNALHGVALSAPAGVAMVVGDPSTALAVGVLPAATLGVTSSRRQRVAIVLVGGVAAAALLAGSLVADTPAVAVVAVLALCVGVAQLTVDRSHRLATPTLLLGVPLFGAGLSLPTISAGLSAGALIAVGSLYAFLVSLLWPSGHVAARPPQPQATRPAMLVYGIQIGLAGALAAAVGFALGVDHPGWACTAALLVSRPDHAAMVARGWGRAVSVIAGALLACGIAALSPASVVFGALLVVLLALGTATAGSRWYVFPFFSTFVVLSLLLIGDTETPAHWFAERVAMTLLGVGLALAAASIVPPLVRRISGGRARPRPSERPN